MISIIIPVYNVKDYLERCITSIKNQTFIDYECIIVNDGSTDGSKEEIERLIKNDNRFILINQENQGLPSARNTGIKYIKNKYVFFLDSDDWIENYTLDYLYNLALENPNVGRIYAPIYVHYNYNGEDIEFTSYVSKYGLLDKNDKAYFLKDGNKFFISNCTSSLYNLNNIKGDFIFPNIKRVEDLLFNMGLLFSGMSTFIADKYVYHYVLRSNSLIHTNINRKDAAKIVAAFKEITLKYSPEQDFFKRCRICIMDSIKRALYFNYN